MQSWPTFAVVILVLGFSGCNTHPHAKVLGHSAVRVFDDIPEPQYQRFEYEYRKRAETDPAKQEALAKGKTEVAARPGFDVPGGASFKILFESQDLMYTKVEFDKDPLRGRVGWIWKGSIDDPRTRTR
ncbi:MAG TPA: hypothetical protein VMH05_19980 [Bryobacteraceae bacterium]|nr:hypothetical protein [Bryobacteraceae bacterium]